MNKKAQGQIITTILIILLVLAAIVIVWQVVNRTVTEGAEQIETQSACLGISMEVTKDTVDATGKTFNVKRIPGGGALEIAPKIVVLVDDQTAAAAAIPTTVTEYKFKSGTVADFKGELISRQIEFGAAPTASVEVALEVDGTVCAISGKWVA